MEWNHSEVIALAKEGCAHCLSTGMRKGSKAQQPCKCVLRNIFCACYRKFRFLASLSPHISTAKLERIPGAVNGPATFGRKNEEYMADFCAVSRKALPNAMEYQIFKFHFLLGGDWKLCCRRLKMERSDFFHAVYRIQQKLGRVYRELQPYGLYPLDEYFGGSVRTERTMACVVPVNGPKPVRAPFGPKAVQMPVPAPEVVDTPLAT